MKKKILYMVRFFSGLHSSLEKGIWDPEGVPTIYKIMEGLDKSKFEVEFILSNYNLFTSARFDKFHTKRELKNFRSKFHVLSVGSDNIWFVRKIKNIIFFFKKYLFLINCIRRFQPDLVYIDRAHIIEGAIIKNFFNCKVFLRMMGVAVYHYNDIIKGKSVFSSITRWAFRNEFDHILFSEDGGDINSFKNKYLKDKISTSTFINGVKKNISSINHFENIKKKYRKKIKLLFVSRLETNKNCDLLLNSFANLDEALRKKTILLIVGTGSQLRNLKNFVKNKKMENTVKFLGSIKHNNVNNIYDISDIFISLNTTGNMSNTCLEAFNSGICCIIPEENKINGCDKVIENYIKKKSIVRIPFKNMDKNLTKTLTELINNNSKVKLYAKNIKYDSKKFLISWNSRVKKEIFLIDTLIKKNK